MKDVLIIVRCGKESIHPSWIRKVLPLADVILSVYDGHHFDDIDSDSQIIFPGGKFQAIYDFFLTRSAVIQKYKYFMLLEDDIILPATSLKSLLKVSSRYSFPVVQPALSQDSFFSWPLTVCNTRFNWRATDFIEIMCPLMSSEFFQKALQHMNHSFSGWGQEFIWRKMLLECKQLASIVDCAPVVHTRPIGAGSLYRNYVEGTVGAFKESLKILETLGIPHVPDFKQYFGEIDDEASSIVQGGSMKRNIILGYKNLSDLDADNSARCLEEVFQRTANNFDIWIHELKERFESESILQRSDHRLMTHFS